jgi:hypothetical protein
MNLVLLIFTNYGFSWIFKIIIMVDLIPRLLNPGEIIQFATGYYINNLLFILFLSGKYLLKELNF